MNSYVCEQNQRAVYDAISSSPLFNTFDKYIYPKTKTQWFKDIIRQFHESNSQCRPQDVNALNCQTLTFMIADIKQCICTYNTLHNAAPMERQAQSMFATIVDKPSIEELVGNYHRELEKMPKPPSFEIDSESDINLEPDDVVTIQPPKTISWNDAPAPTLASLEKQLTKLQESMDLLLSRTATSSPMYLD